MADRVAGMAEYEWNWQKVAIAAVVRGYHVLCASVSGQLYLMLSPPSPVSQAAYTSSAGIIENEVVYMVHAVSYPIGLDKIALNAGSNKECWIQQGGWHSKR